MSQITTTDAETVDGKHADELGVTPADFGSEQGSFSVGGYSTSGTQSFSTTYAVAVPVVMDEATNYTDTMGAWFSGWATDADGNITGLNWGTYIGGSATGYVHWAVFGVPA